MITVMVASSVYGRCLTSFPFSDHVACTVTELPEFLQSYSKLLTPALRIALEIIVTAINGIHFPAFPAVMLVAQASELLDRIISAGISATVFTLFLLGLTRLHRNHIYIQYIA